jgi:outer membrane protein assembly factor BamB
MGITVCRPRTRFVVLDTSFNGQMRSVDLDGMFWFDALSGDGAWLYLLEIQDKGFPQSYGSDRAPNYQVRAYDLSNGALAPEPVVDKREVEQMNGFRNSSALAFDGTWLYSVYTRPNDGPFIHALDLADRVAVCIDLPFETADWETNLLWSVVQAPGSNLLYAVNGATGQVAEVDTTNYQVRRSAVLPRARAAVPDLLARLGDWLAPRAEAKRMVVGGARLSPDGKTLFAIADKGLLVVNTGDLTLRGRYLADSMLSSLALSLDGARLYAVETPGAGANKLLRVDAATGALLGEVKGLNGPQSILSVEPAR